MEMLLKILNEMKIWGFNYNILINHTYPFIWTQIQTSIEESRENR